jgi:hypothetical protein
MLKKKHVAYYQGPPHSGERKNGSVAPAEHLIVDVVVDLEKRRYVKWSDMST